MVRNKKNTKRYIMKGLLGVVAFVLFLISYDNIITSIKTAKNDAIDDSRKREFTVLWEYNKAIEKDAQIQAEQLAKSAEQQLRERFDLDKLKAALDANNTTAQSGVYDVFRKTIDGQYLNGIRNNRNAVIVLEGYNIVIEDKFMEPYIRQHPDLIPDDNIVTFDDYYNTGYNDKLLKSAQDKIRSHTTGQLIAIEPINNMKDDVDHTLITEMNFNNLEEVYIKEGINGLRNYQFLAPVYITDTGDIFGQTDITGGIPQETHKYIVIQTYNLYDQITASNPGISDATHLGHIISRYDNLLNRLYLCGLIICCIFVIMILYFISEYNDAIAVSNILLELKEKNNTDDIDEQELFNDIVGD